MSRPQGEDVKGSWGDVLRANLDSAIHVISGESKADGSEQGAEKREK
jgi:hypothetical protein